MEIAIVLAGGKGSRMQSDIPKQYMQLLGEPLLCHTLRAFQDSFIDEIVLVCGAGDRENVKREIVEKNGFDKVSIYADGGNERYDSVYSGLNAIKNKYGNIDGHIYVHDGARPCISKEILERCREAVLKHHACVAAVMVKDTIKVVNDHGVTKETPDRKKLWQMQTPQVFDYDLIMSAYDKLNECEDKKNITDDAMVVERFTSVDVHVCQGDYCNIKVTTPEDIQVAELFLKRIINL